MKGIIIFLALLLALSTGVFAYTDTGSAFTCNSCADCTNAINNNTYSEIRLTTDILDSTSTCLNNPANFSNKTFDCQSHTIDSVATTSIYGIYLDKQTNNTVKSCTITNFSVAVYFSTYNNNTIILNNTFKSVENDFTLTAYSINNSIINNTFNSTIVGVSNLINFTVHNNTFVGNDVAIYNPLNSTITNNTFINSTVAVDTYSGITNIFANNTITNAAIAFQFARSSITSVSYYSNTIDTTNKIDGKKVYYYVNVNNASIDGTTNAGLVALISCNNITVSNLNMTRNWNGLTIINSTNITLNNITSNSNTNVGIYIFSSGNITVNNTTTSSNENSGIYVSTSGNITIGNSTVNTNTYSGLYFTATNNVTIANNTVKWNIGTDIYETSSYLNAFNNTFYENKNTSFMTLHSNLRTTVNTFTSYNVSIHFSNATPQTYFTVENVTVFPATPLNYTNTTTEVWGNFTPTKAGIYSSRVNVTDYMGNVIVNSFNFYSYYNYGTNFTTQLFYYVRPDLMGVHGQGGGTDVKSMKFDGYTSSDVSFHCGSWIQAYIDENPEYLNGTIKDISLYDSYRIIGGGTRRIYLRYAASNITPFTTVSTTLDYQPVYVNFSNTNYYMGGKSWYSIDLFMIGLNPSLIDGPNYPSYVILNYSTDIPMVVSRMPSGVKLLSSSLPTSTTRTAELVVEGTGSKTIEITMPVAADYLAYRDGTLCNTTVDCNYTKNGASINVTLNLGSAHTITLAEKYYQCYYSNTTGVNITNGINILSTQNLRCNDTSIFTNDNAEITNVGNLTFDNVNLTFSATGNGLAYLYSDGDLVINNTNITSSANHYFIVGDAAGTKIVINYSNIQEAGWADNNYERGIEILTGQINITNTTIENCYIGATLQTDGNYIINSTFDSNGLYGVYIIGNNNIVLNNTMSSNSNTGIYLVGASSNTISNNTVYSNTDGFKLSAGSLNTISGNIVYSNTQYGIYLYPSSYNTISSNTVYSNDGGIMMSWIAPTRASHNIIENNNASSNTVYGVYSLSSTNNTITNNILNSNIFGIDFNNVTNCVISNNTNNFNDYGIEIDYGSNNNTIINNTVNSNNVDGLIMHSSDNNTIINNTFNSNTQHGMYLDTLSNSTITNITINSNPYGIWLDGSNNAFTNITMTNSTTWNIYTATGSTNIFYNITFNTTYASFSGKDISIKEIFDVNAPVNTSGLLSLDSYLNLTNTSTDGWIYLNLTYNSSKSVDETRNRLYKHDGISWSYVSSAADTTNNYVYGNITSFSIFAALEDLPPIRSGGSPSGDITDDAVSMSLSTNENATCRYASTAGTNYTLMDTYTNSAWGTEHSWTISTLVATDYTYYVRCNDTVGNYNIDDYTITFTRTQSGGGSGGGIVPLPIPSPFPIKPAPIADPGDTDTEVPVTDVPINTPTIIPSGGLCMKVANGLCISVFGDKVTVHNITKIDPNQYKVLLCNQTYLEAYEINVTADNAYLCFDTSTVDAKAISIYSFNGEWSQLTNITQKGNQICGKIGSTPYMIAGFKTTPTQQRALDSITLAEKKISNLIGKDVELEKAKSFLEQAQNTYYNCDYESAYNLAQQALKSTPITIPEISLYAWVAVAIGLFGGYWFFKTKKLKDAAKEIRKARKSK